jgi:hypothetical protein
VENGSRDVKARLINNLAGSDRLLGLRGSYRYSVVWGFDGEIRLHVI